MKIFLCQSLCKLSTTISSEIKENNNVALSYFCNRITISINMKKEDAADLKRRAESMHISIGAYVKCLLREWKASGKKLTIEEQ